jgi:hypothetical protein
LSDKISLKIYRVEGSDRREFSADNETKNINDDDNNDDSRHQQKSKTRIFHSNTEDEKVKRGVVATSSLI